MKLLKVKIKRTQANGATHYEYPPEYNPKKFQVLCYETQLTGKYDEVVGRGNTDEYVIGMVADGEETVFLYSPDIVEIKKNECDAFLGVDLDKKVQKITDQDAVIKVLAKSAKKEELTPEDFKVLDPKDQTAGITESKSYNDVLKENGF